MLYREACSFKEVTSQYDVVAKLVREEEPQFSAHTLTISSLALCKSSQNKGKKRERRTNYDSVMD